MRLSLHYFCLFAVLWAIGLLYAGAYTTSIEAGMVFLDWPLSNSSVNPDGWLTDEAMRAEHGHRLLGFSFGLMAIVLIVWTRRVETRKWVKNLALAFFGVVLGQGILGGLRVHLDQLNTGAATNLLGELFCILHATGAQLSVCVLASLTVATSKTWHRISQEPNTVPRSLAIWGCLATTAVFVQIILGAVMRHTGAGMAIPTFPLTPEGGLLPHIWNFPITVHWLHRLGAVIATIGLLIFTSKILINKTVRHYLVGASTLTLIILAVQIFLGAATIWTKNNPVMASSHVLTGAFLLTMTWVLTFASLRLSHKNYADKADALSQEDWHQGQTAHSIAQ